MTTSSMETFQMPADVIYPITGIGAVFAFFAGMVLFADLTWKPRK